MKNSFKLIVHITYSREKLLFNGGSELYKIYPFFQRELPRRSVCHSFAHHWSFHWSPLDQKELQLRYPCQQHLEIFGQGEELVENQRRVVERSQDFFLLSILGTIFSGKLFFLHPASVLQGPWEAPHYGLTLTKWSCILDSRNIVFPNLEAVVFLLLLISDYIISYLILPLYTSNQFFLLNSLSMKCLKESFFF